METNENIHAGHRERLTEKFLKDPTSLSDHEVLEIILFRSLPRINTNPLAHKMIRTFGNLKSVFKASPQDLMKVSGVGKKTATDLALFGQVIKRITETKENCKRLSMVTQKNIEYVQDYFLEQATEGFLVCMLDENFKVITELLYNSGMVHSVMGDLNELVDALSINKPKLMLIAHSHTSDSPEPSKTDDRSTAKIHMMCSAHNVMLIDHIVIAKNKAFSYALEGRLQHIKESCKFENMEF